VHLIVVEMLGGIFNPGISLDGRNFKFLEELNPHDTLGEWGRPIQKAIHPRKFSFMVLLDLELQLVIFIFIFLIECGDGFIKSSFFILRIHHTFTRRRVRDSFTSPGSVFRLGSFREPSALPVFFIIDIAFSFFISLGHFRNSFVR
jgi:hypothetical protein